MIRPGLTTLFLLFAGMAPAGDISFGWPVDCDLGRDCFVQNYVDRDPSPGAQDFACGFLTYDGHHGTDIALLDHVALQNDIAVFAAAKGMVLRLRNDMADWARAPAPTESLDGLLCGNGLVIDHGDGWETQYCHLQEGSIPVRAGQNVAAGDPLGVIGLSGRTEFPHLHFSIRKDGAIVDPFDIDPSTCGPDAEGTLWSMNVPYRATGLVNLGIADHLPGFDAVKQGAITDARLTTSAPALVLWAQVFGGRTGDEFALTLTGPDGVITDQIFVLEKPQARIYRAAGKRLRAREWPLGRYDGRVRLIRDGAVVFDETTTLTFP